MSNNKVALRRGRALLYYLTSNFKQKNGIFHILLGEQENSNCMRFNNLAVSKLNFLDATGGLKRGEWAEGRREEGGEEQKEGGEQRGEREGRSLSSLSPPLSSALSLESFHGTLHCLIQLQKNQKY